jgi:hypothetical protein
MITRRELLKTTAMGLVLLATPSAVMFRDNREIWNIVCLERLHDTGSHGEIVRALAIGPDKETGRYFGKVVTYPVPSAAEQIKEIEHQFRISIVAQAQKSGRSLKYDQIVFQWNDQEKYLPRPT